MGIKILLNFKGKTLSVKLSKQEQQLFKGTSPFLSRGAKGELIVSDDFFEDSRAVRDVHRYDLLFVRDNWALTKPGGQEPTEFASNRYDIPITASKNQLILLLESPHKDEYGPDGRALGPALGATGRNICTLFTSHVLPMLENLGLTLMRRNRYQFCIVNPVPYQASLVDIHKGKLVETVRNKVWMVLWPECKLDFKTRLSQYTPSILLNGCTSKVKDEVGEVIASVRGVQHFDVTHPSGWQRTLAGFHKAYSW